MNRIWNPWMGQSLIIDSQTYILYKDYTIDEKFIAGEHPDPDFYKKMWAGELFSEGPEDYLVLCDIVDAPIMIVREPPNDLVFQARIIPRENEVPKWERPYTAIVLIPTQGTVRAIRLQTERKINFQYKLQSTHPNPNVAFHKIKNRDLEMIIELGRK